MRALSIPIVYLVRVLRITIVQLFSGKLPVLMIVSFIQISDYVVTVSTILDASIIATNLRGCLALLRASIVLCIKLLLIQYKIKLAVKGFSWLHLLPFTPKS